MLTHRYDYFCESIICTVLLSLCSPLRIVMLATSVTGLRRTVLIQIVSLFLNGKTMEAVVLIFYFTVNLAALLTDG